nr:CcdB family protein [uncultured Devosia sp.]
MGRFDVYRLGAVGLVVDVQSDLIPPMTTRLVIPLADASIAPGVFDGLNPGFAIGSEHYVLMTQQMSAIPASLLGKRVASLSREADRIARAIDYILYGF